MEQMPLGKKLKTQPEREENALCLGGLRAEHAGAHRRKGLERKELGIADPMAATPEPLSPPQGSFANIPIHPSSP